MSTMEALDKKQKKPRETSEPGKQTGQQTGQQTGSVDPSDAIKLSDQLKKSPRGELRWWLVICLMLVPIGIAMLVFILVSTSSKGKPATSTASTAVNRVRVGVQQVGSIAAPDVATRYRGLVVPRRESSLSFRRSGPVENVMVDAGDALKAGDTIAVLDTSDLIAQADLADSEQRVAKAQFDEAIAGPRKQTIAAAEARVEQLEAQLIASRNRLNRRQRLVKARAASIEELQDEQQATDRLTAATNEAESQLQELIEGTRSEQIQAAKARLDMSAASRRLIDVQLSDSRIVAPFDCVITERLIDEGSVVGPNQAVVSIAEQPPLEANFGVPASTASTLNIGDEVQISVGKNGDRRQSGTVVRMQPRVDPITRTREMVVEFDTDEISLIGQPATLWLSADRLRDRQALASTVKKDTEANFWIPSGSLVRGVRGLWAIYAARPDETNASSGATKGFDATVSLLDAKIIKTAGPMSLVTVSLSADDWIITDGVHRVAPGVHVTGIVR
ncbi:Multidrug resistance protein MdtA precursor [Rubripirellula obstinata]|uniref:Multidrug resistance protein MdtA n=1 Tax=Rubripirellula obstinata TaxID=406547 RepID=A0A5B1CGF8_9BACT|nr:efflux RND transporter periplasmic adaptor subunit [Rubripirellula obstinata]KAA1258670.1 Multidrug resistance protein MdtA precursor [Rubripirellula obstinata]